jgi:hypothetical protein
LQTAIRVANFDSEVPALNRREVLAHRKVCESEATHHLNEEWRMQSEELEKPDHSKFFILHSAFRTLP